MGKLEDSSAPRIQNVNQYLDKVDQLISSKEYIEAIDYYYNQKPADEFHLLQEQVKELASEIKAVKAALRKDTDKRLP